MFLWFAGTAVITVWIVFRDPRFDYRLLVVGAVLPVVVDALTGGAWILHTLTFSVVLLVVTMLATRGRRELRRTWLGLPLGTLLHLVFDAAWADTEVFWWPFSGASLGESQLPEAGRGWWNVLLELAGLLLVVWIVRRARLVEPDARRRFLTTGQLALGALGD